MISRKTSNLVCHQTPTRDLHTPASGVTWCATLQVLCMGQTKYATYLCARNTQEGHTVAAILHARPRGKNVSQ